MRMSEFAESFLKRAKSRLLSSEAAFSRGEYPDVVRHSQECVEFSIKAILRLVGVEYPKKHEVSDVMLEVKEMFPEWLQRDINRMAEISKKLAMEREPSVYGEEETGVPPSKLFGEKEAEAALNEAREVYERCEKFFRRFLTAKT